jgi:gamma-glutamyl-gamma-aminobutyrate hydrolase PuuD
VISPDVLTSEIVAITQFFKLKEDHDKITPLEIIAHAHENSERYPEINKMYRYAVRALSAVDGILIPGGSDINPLFYGQEKHALTVPGDMRRDVLEFMLIYLQRRSNMPLFAVCRGSQAVGLAYGADFVPHIRGRRPIAENFHIENNADNSESGKRKTQLFPGKSIVWCGR